MKRIIVAAFAAVLIFASGARAGEYNLYFGGNHSHTSFSDGSLYVEDAFDTARYKGNCDFWFVTDHYQKMNMPGMLADGTQVIKWKYQNDVAKKKTEDGKFVALVGWEWSDGIQAHMNVLFDPAAPPDFLLTGTFDRFKNVWILKHPKTITGINHPFWSIEHKMTNLEGFKYIPELDAQTAYIEVVQWEDIPFYYVALDHGWHVAPLAAQDNHSPNWGLQPEFNAVYAKELTYEGLKEAFIARRFYATNDRGMKINFEGNGKPMGSQLKGDLVKLKVTVSREDGLIPAYVRIVSKEGTIVKEWIPTISESKYEVTVPVMPNESRWYVAYVAMPNDKYSISAPIWISSK